MGRVHLIPCMGSPPSSSGASHSNVQPSPMTSLTVNGAPGAEGRPTTTTMAVALSSPDEFRNVIFDLTYGLAQNAENIK
uniref:Uncharacterized protein n=1 Tax=Romanomermis culicivorax TaxID=13658 RepID=A0A915JKY3_ROMCU